VLTWRTVRVMVLVAVLFSFVRAVIGHAPHLGPLEWVVSVMLVLLVLTAIVPVRRSA
jgi:hypothetical protein